MSSRLLAAPVLLCAAACAADPAVSSVFSLEVRIPSTSVIAGTAFGDAAVRSEAGDPFGEFLAQARETLGHDPEDIDVPLASVTLLPTSIGVPSFDAAFTGLRVVFLMDSSGAAYEVGAVNAPVLSGPIRLEMQFDRAALTAADRADLAAGAFTMRVLATAKGDFLVAEARADVKVVLRFDAYD